MTRAENNEEREERIKTRVIVDTYSPEEQAWGWYAYLDDTMDFPFEARCLTEQEESPLKEGKTIRMVGMSPTDPTLRSMAASIILTGRRPLTGKPPCPEVLDSDRGVGPVSRRSATVV
jgi:hypothetical protein